MGRPDVPAPARDGEHKIRAEMDGLVFQAFSDSELRDIIWEEGSEVRFAAPVLQRGRRELLYVITPYRLIH